MNVLIVDTSSWISYFKNKKESSKIDSALSEGRVFVSPIVVSELLSGKMTDKNRKDLESFLSELPLTSMNFDHSVKVGKLRSDLIKKGFSVSTPDAHIAQSAMDMDAYLISEDKIFQKISKVIPLKVEGQK
ncbi:MAG: PIN domain-containing protein [Deltaproteobacteria bacterium]|nr:PIN domain-containing protein [Deltaproteobacteria bacterium]